jgi:uncharacterized protein YdeI (YjbR/CyaY-like superfamily)
LSNAQVADMKAIVRAYLKEAMGYADAGVKPAKEKSEIDLPDEFVEALDFDPELAEAFRSLTPGHVNEGARDANSKNCQIP